MIPQFKFFVKGLETRLLLNQHYATRVTLSYIVISWFVAASEEGREKSKVRSYPFRLVFCGLNNDNMKLVRCSILCWWCVILLKCVLVRTNIVKLSEIGIKCVK